MPIEDFLATRPCPTCEGGGEELYFDGAAFRTAREEKGLSLRELAAEVKCSKTHLADLERADRQYTENFARRVLTALGLL